MSYFFPCTQRKRCGIILLFFSLTALLPIPLSAASSKYSRPHKDSKKPEAKTAPTEYPVPAKKTDGFQIHYPAQVTPEIRQRFKEADSFYRKSDWVAAEQRFLAFIGRYPHTALKDAALYRLAELSTVRNKPQESRSYLTELVAISPDPEWQERARFLLGRSFYMSAEYQNAYTNLLGVQPNFLENWQQVHYYSLLIRLEEKRKESSTMSAYYFLRLFDTYQGLSSAIPGTDLSWIVSEEEVRRFLEKWTLKEELPATAPVEITHYVGGPAAAYALFHVGYNYFRINDKQTARRYLSDYSERYPDHPYTERARELLGKIGDTQSDEKYGRPGYQIGVMLPFSGPYRKFGYEVLRGLRCANGDDLRCGGSHRVTFIVRDTEGDPEITAQIFRDFVRDNDVQAVIGPLSMRGMATIIEDIKDHDDLAVITLSQYTTDKEAGNLFYVTLSPDTQVRRLIDEVKAQGIYRVGALYPDNGYGREMVTQFKNELEARGGQVISSRSYRTDGQNLTDVVRELKLNVASFSLDNPKTFDALFIPDSQGRVKWIMTILASQNLTGIPLIGSNAWNGEPFPLALETLFPNSFFTDLYLPQGKQTLNPSNTAAIGFADRFRQTYGHDPDTLEALSYDLLHVLGEALTKGGGKSRSELKKQLHNIDHYKGVTGFQGFGADGQAQSTVYLITQKNGMWVRISK